MTLTLRPEVAAFAQLMEAKLRANDHKTGWKRCTATELFARADEELVELRQALKQAQGARRLEGDVGRAPSGWGHFCLDDTHRIAGEGADVANMVMMVLDVVGALDIDGDTLAQPKRRPR